MNRKNKRGSYLVEAAMVIPIFVLAVIMLMSGVPTISTAENVMFSITDEMRYETVKTAFRESPYVLSARLIGRLRLENERLDGIPLVDCQYLYTEAQIEDLITVEYWFSCSGNDPFRLFRRTAFSGRVTARAFTGALHKTAPTQELGNDRMVYIFPEWGMRYHRDSCTYVKSSCQMVYFSQETKKDFDPCSLCDAESAQIGSPVFCFLRYGEVYHLADCRQVKRYYTEIELQKAEQQGYSPCSKCGG